MNEVLKTKLNELGLTDDQIGKLEAEGVKEEGDLSGLNRDDVKGITGCGLVIAGKVVSAFAPQEQKVAPVATASMALNFSADVLPSVPSDESWLAALRAGGVLKVDQSTVISAVRAALAYRAGLYSIPEKLAARMESFADENAEAVSSEFFKLRRQLTRRSYGEIFEAIEGLDGTFVTEARRKMLFGRIDTNLWPAIEMFYGQLKGWVEAWQQGANNPAAMMGALAMLASGGTGGVMPPGMMSPPDCGVVRDGAESFNDSMNKVFSGVGAQIAAALAFDASKIKETLENPQLPSLIGVANRDQMLRALGVEVSATYPRMETNLTRFVLGIMKVKDIAAGNEELQYFVSLFMLGSQIPWDSLGLRREGGRSGIGGIRTQL